MWKVVFAVMAVLTGLALNLYYNQPVPEGMPSDAEFALRICGAMYKSTKFLANIGSLIGLGNYYPLIRDLVAFTTKHSSPKPPSDMEITDITLAGIPVRVYKPYKGAGEGDKKLAGLVYYHGGGWTVGSIEDYNNLCQELSRAANIIVVSVEYRLAPEHTFPAQYDDCYSIATTLLSKGEMHGIDPSRIILSGDSAGGNLAAAVTQQLKNQRNHPVAQILIYPAVQALDFTLPSMKKYGDSILAARTVAAFWSLYLNGTTELTDIFVSGSHALHLKNTKYTSYIRQQNKAEPQKTTEVTSPLPYVPEGVRKALTDPRVSPLMADSLEGLPLTLLITAQFDVLSSEGLLYKLRLQDSGVKVTHVHVQSFHAFFHLTFDGPLVTDEGKHAFSETVRFIKQFELQR